MTRLIILSKVVQIAGRCCPWFHKLKVCTSYVWMANILSMRAPIQGDNGTIHAEVLTPPVCCFCSFLRISPWVASCFEPGSAMHPWHQYPAAAASSSYTSLPLEQWEAKTRLLLTPGESRAPAVQNCICVDQLLASGYSNKAR